VKIMDTVNFEGISIFEVIDYIYCPRIIYYEKTLKIFGNKMKAFKEEEKKRLEGKGMINRRWIWDRLKLRKQSINNLEQWNNKEFSKELYSQKYYFHGKLDEILYLEEGTIVPLYYHNSKYTAREDNQYKNLMTLFFMLIEENYQIECQKGYILFLNDSSLKKIECTTKDFESMKQYINETLNLIETEKYPLEAEGGTKCRDCYYKKICGR
jgi:CRISPR-associated protein Cas4